MGPLLFMKDNTELKKPFKHEKLPWFLNQRLRILSCENKRRTLRRRYYLVTSSRNMPYIIYNILNIEKSIQISFIDIFYQSKSIGQ